MPRGLGEDPLSRQKKKRGRSKSKATTGGTSPSTDAAGELSVSSPVAEQSANVVASGPGSAPLSEYNDVFFQKRDEVAPASTEQARSVAGTGAVSVPGAVPSGPEEGPKASLEDPPPAAAQRQVSEQPQAEHRRFLNRIFGKLGRHSAQG